MAILASFGGSEAMKFIILNTDYREFLEWVINRPKRGFAPAVREWHDALFTAYGDSLRDGYLTQSGVLSQESSCQLATDPFPPGVVTPISFKALVWEQWCRQMAGLCPMAGN